MENIEEYSGITEEEMKEIAKEDCDEETENIKNETEETENIGE